VPVLGLGRGGGVGVPAARAGQPARAVTQDAVASSAAAVTSTEGQQ
jgi:hypothetical protein